MSIAKHRIESVVSCSAFNGDFSQIALSPNSNTIFIYQISNLSETAEKWKKIHTLKEHDSIVSSLDWSSESNFIVSCGHDRNAYVWKYDPSSNHWVPTLVILRINRAANVVRWSPNGTKFAVGSSAKTVPVCRYESSNDWWVSKMIKKHKSTVLSVSWHPNNVFLLTGGCDAICRIFSGYIEELDTMDGYEELVSLFPKYNKFGTLLAEIDCSKSWIEDVCWAPDGIQGAFVSHDPALTFFGLSAISEKKVEVQTIKLGNLPFRVSKFVDNFRLIAAGHDNNPFLFQNNNEAKLEWKFVEKLDKEKGEKTVSNKKVTAFAANKALFQKTTTQGASSLLEKTDLNTLHQNQIIGLSIIGDGAEFFSSGLDGRVVYWKLK